MRSLATLGIVATLSMVPAVSHAYRTLGAKWNQTPVTYLVDLNSSQELGRDLTRQVVESSFARWAAPACSDFSTTWGGELSNASADANDRRNVLVWRYSSWPSAYGSGAIGVTTPVFFNDGAMVDADIEFNGVNFDWTTSPARMRDVDAESIVVHEIGHFLGLDHSPDPQATMYAAYTGGTGQRTLNTDDIAGVCALYPTGTTGNECSAAQPCPTGQTCQNGFCVTQSGGGGNLGDSCNAPDDCSSPDFCACTDSSQTNCFCTRNCTDQSPCPNGFSCAPLQGGGGACVTGQSGGSGQLGDPCQSGADCANGFCVGTSTTAGICSRSCSAGAPCPTGYTCYDLQGGGSACAPGSPPPDGGTTPPDGGTTPPADAGTTPPPDAGTTTPPTGLGLGASCTSTNQCSSQWCAYLANASARLCTQTCSTASPCPSGFTCGQLLGGTFGCIPGSGTTTTPDGGPTFPPFTQDGGTTTGTTPPRTGCSAAGGAMPGLPMLLLLALGWVGLRRRRE